MPKRASAASSCSAAAGGTVFAAAGGMISAAAEGEEISVALFMDAN